MIDLHVHTYYSDGTKSPAEVVRLAKKNGVDVIAITDHDGTDGVAEALEAGKALGVRVIPGIEISVKYRGGEMHILGYNIDLSSQKLKEAVEWMRACRRERNIALYEAFRDIGIPITEEEIRAVAVTDYVGKPQFAMALVRRGLVKSVEEAFESPLYFRNERIRRVPRPKPEPKDGIGIILDAGGIPVLAHPYTLRQSLPQLDATLRELECYGLMGMECYYSDYSEAESQVLVDLARAHGLIITTGSDFHGEEMDSEIRIGTGRAGNLADYSDDTAPFD